MLPDTFRSVGNAYFEEVSTPMKRRRPNPGQSLGQTDFSQSIVIPAQLIGQDSNTWFHSELFSGFWDFFPFVS